MSTNATEDRMLQKVRALVAKAESTDSAPEREALIAKAEALMLKHSIDQAMLDMNRPADQRIKPEALEYFQLADYGTPIRDQIVDLGQWVAYHFGCKIIFFGLRRGKTTSAVHATIVGFPSDLRSFQTLFTALHLDLAAQLRPKPDNNKTFDQNVYDLHEAGVKWIEIANAMNRAYEQAPAGTMRAMWRDSVRPGKDQPENLVPWPDGHRLINAYKRHCKAIGEEPRSIQSPVTYQRNFASAYVSRIHSRLVDSRLEAEETAGAGTALALRTDSIDEVIAEMFPKLGTAAPRKDLRYDSRARAAGRNAADRADIGGKRMGSDGRRQLG
jgi:hypothetical protein